MIYTVANSDIDEIWENQATLFFDIVELVDDLMRLKNESGYVSVWTKTQPKAAAAAEGAINSVIEYGPVVVNLNKHRSNDKNRYLCLNLNFQLKELMPDQQPPAVHPRVRDAAIMFLSSLVFEDIKDFDRLKGRNQMLVDVINPYMEGMVEKIEIDHVIVADNVSKVDEFIIEHTMKAEAPPEEGEAAEEGAAQNGDGEASEDK